MVNEFRLVMVANGVRDDRSIFGQGKSEGILSEKNKRKSLLVIDRRRDDYNAVQSSPCLLRFSTSKWNFFFNDEFQWFFMELSDLPLKYFAISAHLFPKCWWRINKRRLSSFVQGFLLINGLRWLCHLQCNDHKRIFQPFLTYLSRHCFPTRPFNSLAIKLQCLAP